MIYPITFFPDEVRVWVRLRPDETSEDLEPRVRITHTIGTPPSWYTDDMYEDGGQYDFIREAMHLDGRYREESGLGWTFVAEMTQWALRRGIAPGQHFQIWMREPQYERDYWGEVDESQEAGLLEVEPWPVERIRQAWEGWLKQRRSALDRARLQMRALSERRERDISAMYITSYHWSSYCWEPSMVRWMLRSKHHKVKGFNKYTQNELMREEGPAAESLAIRARLLERAQEKYGIQPEKVPQRH